MKLIPAKQNMYPWCDFTANPLQGRCPHDCRYCYMKDIKKFAKAVRHKYRGPQRVSEKSLSYRTGRHKIRRREDLPFVPDDKLVIFVCSGNDLGTAPREAKEKILEGCWEEPDYFYLLQSKYPAGLKEVEEYFPPNTILGTTVETNRANLCAEASNAPSPQERIEMLNEFNGNYWKMISGEPKMMCDPNKYASLIKKAEPDFFSLGADRGGRHNLDEPSKETLLDLVPRVDKFTRVFLKENLDRLVGGKPSLKKLRETLVR